MVDGSRPTFDPGHGDIRPILAMPPRSALQGKNEQSETILVPSDDQQGGDGGNLSHSTEFAHTADCIMEGGRG